MKVWDQINFYFLAWKIFLCDLKNKFSQHKIKKRMRAIYTHKNKQEMENILLYTSHFPTSHTNKLFLLSKRP